MSYEYLGQDGVIAIPLCRRDGMIGKEVLEVNPGEEERAMRLHKESVVIDFHNHLKHMPENPKDLELYVRSGRIATGYEGIRRSGMTACFDAVGGSAGRRYSPRPWQFEDTIWDLGMRQADKDHHQDVVIRAYSVKDIWEAKKTGRTAVFASAENAGIIHNDLDKLDVLYGLGIRSLGLTYNDQNIIGCGITERRDSGLSDFGFKVIERMNRLGMLIDFAHCSDLTIREGIEASDAPCCCSHTFARAVNENPKGLSNGILELFAKHNGVVAVEAVPNVTSFKKEQTIWDVVDHLDYIVKLIGVDHVAIGTDASFSDHVASHKTFREAMGMKGMVKDFPGTHIEYLENPGQLPNVTRALVARGYSEEDIKKIIGGNVLRLLEQTIG